MLTVEKGDSLSLIIPAYNEKSAIAKTIGEAVRYFESQALPFEIIVVADGDDGTRELVAEMRKSDPRLHVLGSEKRSGKGKGVREGILAAQMKYVGFTDADNKTPIEEFEKFFTHLKGGVPVVIGSRAKRGAQIENPQPWFRRIGSRGFSAYLRCVLGLWSIPDTQCGFKFFKTEVAKELFSGMKVQGYMFDVELLHLAAKRKLQIVQIPVRWRDDGDSRLELFRGNLKNAQDILKIRFNLS